MNNENKLLGKQLNALRDHFKTLPTEVLMMALGGWICLDQLAHEAIAARGWSEKKNCMTGKAAAFEEYVDRWAINPEY